MAPPIVNYARQKTVKANYWNEAKRETLLFSKGGGLLGLEDAVATVVFGLIKCNVHTADQFLVALTMLIGGNTDTEFW